MPQVGSLEHARTCYAHLAGWLGVQIADALQAKVDCCCLRAAERLQ